MLPLELERALLPLTLKTPAFAPLFQLPPQLKARSDSHPMAIGLLYFGFQQSADHLSDLDNHIRP